MNETTAKSGTPLPSGPNPAVAPPLPVNPLPWLVRNLMLRQIGEIKARDSEKTSGERPTG